MKNENHKMWLMVCIFFIGITWPADFIYADQVTTSSRVDTRLRVRADPNAQSNIVGYLYPGDSARLLKKVPYWFEISLNNETPGFVSKAWARVIPDFPDAPDVLRIGAWNIRKLGHGSKKNYPLVAQIIGSTFDVMTVVEVMQKGGTHPGYDNLISELGTGWKGMVTNSPRPNTTAGHAEFYAVLYRPNMVRPCDGWNHLIYFVDGDGSNGTGDPPDRFSREPAFGCFVTISSDGSEGFDFLLSAYHARWADGDILDITEEVELLDEVYSAMASAQPGERDLMIAGDFNLVPSDLGEALSQEISTLGTGSTLNGSGELTSNLYDHLLVFDGEATSEIIGEAEIVDVRPSASDNRTFFRTVSDHLPVVARFHLMNQDDD